MRKRIRSGALLCVLALLCAGFGGCGEKHQAPLPAVLQGQSYIFDEQANGTGERLYTLRFTEDGCFLNADGADGVLYRGTVTASADKTLRFSGKGAPADASYTGSAFEDPSVTLTFDGRPMTFAPATETTEYVYLSYLGVFTGSVGGKDAVLILERWFEWYLYTDGTLSRGTYEVFADGSVELTPADGKMIRGTVQNAQPFDLRQTKLSLKLHGKTSTFSFAKPLETYDAAHAMGTYTLSLYPQHVFTIHGVDGFLKAMGTLRMDEGNGTAAYFPRAITNEAEKDYTVSVTKADDTFFFPAKTYLLPRSGNISEETGFGSYWSAGTKLEFIRSAQKTASESARDIFPTAVSTGHHHLPDTDAGLRQVMPSVGTAKPLALLIEFPDFHHPRHVTAEGVQDALFSLEQPDSLSAYYYISSYGKLTIDGTVLGWYCTAQPRSAYDSDSEIMAEAIEHYIENESLRLEDYDGDSDGTVDALYVLWAGNMESGTGMWDSAYRSSWKNSPETWNRKVSGYIFVPGSTIWSSVPPLRCNTNSLVHETGHLLGLNDYYSYDTPDRALPAERVYTGGAPEGGLGGMDMMDANIGDHNVFSKWLLGWAEPTVIEYADIPTLSGRTVTLRPSSRAGDAVFIKLRDADDLYTELFVIESVMPELNAAEYTRLTEPVVRVMHVENSLPETDKNGGWRGFGFAHDNSYTTTKYIGILEADGKDEVLHFAPDKGGEKLSYDPADYFRAGDTVTPDTYPNTNAYDAYGNASVPTGLCITVESVAADGTAKIRLDHAEPKETLHITDVTPAPCVVPYTAEAAVMPQGTKTITLTFDRDVQWTDEPAVRVLTGHSAHETVENVQTKIAGNTLTLSFPTAPKKGETFTLVLPANCVCSTQDASVKNNCSSIFGFIAS